MILIQQFPCQHLLRIKKIYHHTKRGSFFEHPRQLFNTCFCQRRSGAAPGKSSGGMQYFRRYAEAVMPDK